MFVWADRNSLKEKAASEQRLWQVREWASGCLEKALLTEGITRAKVWKQEHDWHSLNSKAKPAWLEQSEQGREQQEVSSGRDCGARSPGTVSASARSSVLTRNKMERPWRALIKSGMMRLTFLRHTLVAVLKIQWGSLKQVSEANL